MESDFRFRRTLGLTNRRVAQMATIMEEDIGTTLTKKQLAQAQADGLPETIVTYGREINGFLLKWQAPSTPPLYGYTHLLPVKNIYGDVTEGSLYFDFSQEEFAHEIAPLDPRLLVYRPVDQIHNNSVGLLHDERHSPELYYYNAHGLGPDLNQLLPLGIDLRGYVQLLYLSCGFAHWVLLLVQLASPEGQARPFRLLPGLYENTTREPVEQITQLLPDFSLDAFAALYDQVKLPIKQTWAACGGQATDISA